MMTSIRRRAFLRTGTAAAMLGVAPVARALNLGQDTAPPAGIQIGACVVGLDQAAQAGLEGVEVGVGGPADTLDIARPETIARLQSEMSRTALPVCSLMMGLLNECPLATDPRGERWLEQSIDAAATLKARVILVAFFGNGDLLGPDGAVKRADVDAVVAKLKNAAPRAAAKGVVLAIENYLDANQNAAILDRIGHDAVSVYYDCYNTGASKGYDVPAEIRQLRDRIVQFHFKNGPDFLDNGKVVYPPIARAIQEIDYKGFIVLETSSPTKDALADVARNARYARSLFER